MGQKVDAIIIKLKDNQSYLLTINYLLFCSLNSKVVNFISLYEVSEIYNFY